MTDGPTITYDSQNNNLGLFGYIHMPNTLKFLCQVNFGCSFRKK